VKMGSILLIGVDTPTGLSIMRELGRHGVAVHAVGADIRGLGAASRYCHKFWPKGRGAIVEWLPDLIDKTDVQAVIAWSENDLKALAELPETINGCRILTPRADALAKVLDKAQTLKLAREMGIETPRNWQEMPDIWPVVVKWPDPMRIMAKLDAAGLDFHKAEFCRNPDALRNILERYEPIGEKPMVQSYAKGRGIGQMFYMHGGKATLFFQHERIHEWPPEGGVSTLCRSVSPDQHQDQRKKSEELLVAMGWEGPAMVEYRWEPEGSRYILMEINGRFWGSQPLATHAGAEFGWEHYRCQMIGSDDATPPPYRINVQARYMVPEIKRLYRLFFQTDQIADPFFKANKWSELGSFILSFFKTNMRYYVFAIDDPGPFFADAANIIRKALRRDS